MRWYGTFGVNTLAYNRYVVIEAETREAAHAEMTRRFGRQWSLLYTESSFRAPNWQGHTHAQRFGLSELTAQEEEQLHESRDGKNP